MPHHTDAIEADTALILESPHDRLLAIHALKSVDDINLLPFLDTLAYEFPIEEQMRPSFFLKKLHQPSDKFYMLTAHDPEAEPSFVGVLCYETEPDNPCVFLWFLAVSSRPKGGTQNRHDQGYGKRLYRTLIHHLKTQHPDKTHLFFEVERPDICESRAARNQAVRRLHYYLSASQERVCIALETPYATNGDLCNKYVPMYLCSDAFAVSPEERNFIHEYDLLAEYFAEEPIQCDVQKRLADGQTVRNRFPRALEASFLNRIATLHE